MASVGAAAAAAWAAGTASAPEVRPSYFTLERVVNGEIARQLDMVCAVCRDIVWQGMETPCGHLFCRTCIHQALVHRNKCPVDNTPLQRSQLFSSKLLDRIISKQCVVKCDMTVPAPAPAPAAAGESKQQQRPAPPPPPSKKPCEWSGSLADYAHHQSTAHKPHRCTHARCNEYFADAKALSQHVRRVHYLKCPAAGCRRSFASTEQLRSHQQARKHRLKCKVHRCHVLAWTTAELDTHSSVHPMCGECDKRFMTEESKEHHQMDLGHTDGEFECEECGAVFTDEEDFMYHVDLHNEQHGFPVHLGGQLGFDHIGGIGAADFFRSFLQPPFCENCNTHHW